MYSIGTLYWNHGFILGIVSFLVSQLQHFHWWFFFQPGKKSKEKDVEKMFKLNRGQHGCSPRVFPSPLPEWKSCPQIWQWGESRLMAAYVVMQRHGIAQKKKKKRKKLMLKIPRTKWKFSTLFFGSMQKYACMHGGTHARATGDGNINFLLKIPMRLCVV